MDHVEAYLLSTEKAIAGLASKTSGLDQEEAKQRLARHGANQLTGKKKASPVVIFFRQFLNPLVYILVAAASIKAFVKGPFDALVIVGVLLFMAIRAERLQVQGSEQDGSVILWILQTLNPMFLLLLTM